MENKIYPDSGIELSPFISKHYDGLMNIASFGKYRGFIHRAIADMNVQADDNILDLGCGTGRNSALMSSSLSKNASVTGIDLSDIMGKQFIEKFAGDKRFNFVSQGNNNFKYCPAS